MSFYSSDYKKASSKIDAKSLASPNSCGAEPCLKPQAPFGAASEKQLLEVKLSFLSSYLKLTHTFMFVLFVSRFFFPQVPVFYFVKCTGLQKGGPLCSVMEPCM